MNKILALALAAVSTVVVVSAGTAEAGAKNLCKQYSATAPVRLTTAGAKYDENSQEVSELKVVLSLKACFNGSRIYTTWDPKVEVVGAGSTSPPWQVVSQKVSGGKNRPNLRDGWLINGDVQLKKPAPLQILGWPGDEYARSLAYIDLVADGRCTGGELEPHSDSEFAVDCNVSAVPPGAAPKS